MKEIKRNLEEYTYATAVMAIQRIKKLATVLCVDHFCPVQLLNPERPIRGVCEIIQLSRTAFRAGGEILGNNESLNFQVFGKNISISLYNTYTDQSK